jgi:hypothetical protein
MMELFFQSLFVVMAWLLSNEAQGRYLYVAEFIT